MSRWSWVMLAVLAVGCGDDGGPDTAADIEFTNQGTGLEGTNLDPVRLGTVHGRFGLVVGSAASGGGLVEHDFTTGMAEVRETAEAGAFVTTPFVPGTPLLRVPAVVREGMAWRLSAGGTVKAPGLEMLTGTLPIATITGAGGVPGMLHGDVGGPVVLTDSLGVSTGHLFGEPDGPGLEILESWPLAEQLAQVVPLGPTTPGAEVLLLADSQHFVTWTRRQGDRFEHPRTGGRLGGRLSVHAQRGAWDVLVVAADGGIDRLALEGDELVTYHLADVAVPAGEWAIGAFAVNDHLVVGTLRLGTANNFGQNYHLSLYRTAQTLGAGHRASIPAALTVIEKPIAGGVNAVCWRGTGAAADPTTWTADGLAPAFAVSVSAGPDDCVVIGGGTSLAGTIPGIGRVVVTGPGTGAWPAGFEAASSDESGGLAALTDGSFVATRRRFARGGLDLGLPDVPGPIARTTSWSAAADHAGAGLWVTDGAQLTLKAATTITPPGPALGLPVSHALIPTGVAVSNLATFFVPPTGAPVEVGDATHSACWRRADGAICGILAGTPRQVYCRTAAGTETTFTTLGGLCTALPSGPDRYAYATGLGQVLLIDLAAGTETSIEDDGQVIGQTVDHHGRGLFALRLRSSSDVVLATPTPTGLVEVARIPEAIATSGGSTPGFSALVSTDEMLVADAYWTNGNKARLVLPPLPAP